MPHVVGDAMLLVLEVIKNEIQCVVDLIESIVHALDQKGNPERDRTHCPENHPDRNGQHLGSIVVCSRT